MYKQILSMLAFVLFAFLAIATWDGESGEEFFGGQSTASGCISATFLKDNEIFTKQTGLLIKVLEKDEFFLTAPISEATVRISVVFVDYVKTEEGDCKRVERHSFFTEKTNFSGNASFLLPSRVIDNINEYEVITADVKKEGYNSMRKKLFPVYFRKDYVQETFELVSKQNL